MNTIARLAAATALTSILAACGGGGGTSGPDPHTPPPTDPSPDPTPRSTDTEDLIEFVQNGNMIRLDDGVSRRTRSFTQDGEAGTVAVDRLAGTDFGLVQYRLGNDVHIYRLTGEPVQSMTLPSGFYNGPLSMDYRFDGNSGWAAMSGEVNFALDFETGALAIGGIAGNDDHSISIFGDTTVVGNRFETDDVTLRLRDVQREGEFIRDENGRMHGIAVSEDGNPAIFGLIDSDGNPSGFMLRGGYSAIIFDD